MVSKDAQTKIGQARRTDAFGIDKSKADMPGPGALDPYDPPSENSGFQFARDDRFPKDRPDGPGPGAYELLEY